MQNHGRGYFEDEVAKKENARTEAEHLRRQAEFFVHGQCGEPYVDSIDKSYEIEQHQKRNQSPGDLANCLFFEEAGSRCCDVAHTLPFGSERSLELQTT